MSAAPPAPSRLFCFPYAGGSAAIYRGWQAALGPQIDVQAVELPGRGSRFREAPVGDLRVLAQRLAEEIAPQLDRPFAIFGHSIGALIGYELTHCLHRSGQPLPQWLLLSAKSAPQHAQPNLRRRHLLSDADFKQMLREMGGTPDSVLESDDMMSRFLPVLRADFSLSGTYEHALRPPLPTTLFLFGASGDSVPEQELLGWREHVRRYAGCDWNDGKHFFVHSHAAQLQARIRALLLAGD